MTDHLTEARRLATDIYYKDDEKLAREQTANAIEHLADAIEELQATINPELTVRTAVKDCYECETTGRNCIAHPAPPSEAVSRRADGRVDPVRDPLRSLRRLIQVRA